MSTEKIAQSGISQVMEGGRLFAHLTVEENLHVGARAKRKKGSMRNDLDMIYGYFPRLRTMRNAIAGYCSGDEQQMVSIGRSLVSNPKIMLLDEPSMGVSPLLVQEIKVPSSSLWRVLQVLRQRGYVHFDERRRTYRIGFQFLYMGNILMDGFGYWSLARDYFKKLAEESGETTELDVRIRDQLILIDQRMF